MLAVYVARAGQPTPCIIPFSTSSAAALQAFHQYQKENCFKLQAGNLLSSDYQLTPAFLPFWLFEAIVSAEATCSLGRKADKSDKNSPMVWTKMSEWKEVLSKHQLREAESCMQIRLKVHQRRARLVYFPAYHLHYIHGEKYTPSRADIIPAEYDALIAGGGRPVLVAAELHPSPLKSQAAAAAAVAGLGCGVLPLTGLALGVDPSLAGITGADAALLAVLAASGAGAVAARLPFIIRNKHAAEQAAADQSFYRQYDQSEAAHGSPPDEHTHWLWKDADWRRWERDEPWSWVPAKRKAAAELLFKQHAQRELDRLAAQQQQEQQSRQRAEEEEREAQRQQKFGRSRRFTSTHQFGAEAGTGPNHQQPQQRRRRDFLGYYKALGINLEEAGVTISLDYIKSHYKAAALKLHPDKHVHSDEATQRRQAEKFRRLQLAYETLRDSEKRRAYDQGRLVQ
eukprot:gene4862-5107_t